MKYAVGLKSVKHKHYVAQLKLVLWCFKRGGYIFYAELLIHF